MAALWYNVKPGTNHIAAILSSKKESHETYKSCSGSSSGSMSWNYPARYSLMTTFDCEEQRHEKGLGIFV